MIRGKCKGAAGKKEVELRGETAGRKKVHKEEDDKDKNSK
jgi:hypothetical protein